MARGALALALTAAFTALGASPARAAPQPGLWLGQKGGVQLSFTVRAEGGGRTVADVVTFCGQDASAASTDPFVPDRFDVARGGRIAGWPRGRARLGTTSATLDAHTTISGRTTCPPRDFDGIRVRRGPARPIQDGRYHGAEAPAYEMWFDVIGGGVLFRPDRGFAGIPDPQAALGACGLGGGPGDDARIGPDGGWRAEVRSRGFAFVLDGAFASPTSASGSYTYEDENSCARPGPISGSHPWRAELEQAAPGSLPPGLGVGGGAGGRARLRQVCLSVQSGAGLRVVDRTPPRRPDRRALRRGRGGKPVREVCSKPVRAPRGSAAVAPPTARAAQGVTLQTCDPGAEAQPANRGVYLSRFKWCQDGLINLTERAIRSDGTSQVIGTGLLSVRESLTAFPRDFRQDTELDAGYLGLTGSLLPAIRSAIAFSCDVGDLGSCSADRDRRDDLLTTGTVANYLFAAQVRHPDRRVYGTATLRLALRSPEGTPAPIVELTDTATFRCNRTKRGRGCVVPGYLPSAEFSLSSPKHGLVAAHMADAEASLANHPGRQADGIPLTRQTDLLDIVANRLASCGAFKPTIPQGSCDEYPFASTEEGAARPGALLGVDFSVREVPLSQNRSQGGVLGRFYRRNRVLDGDSFWVRVGP